MDADAGLGEELRRELLDEAPDLDTDHGVQLVCKHVPRSRTARA
jgi:hypothetical protein